MLASRRQRRARPPGPSTHSGWARTRSESRLTISGSNHRPNSMPRPLTWSTSGPRPSGQTSADTCQSPRPRWSSRRPPNQPSSSTNRSTPIEAAVSASRCRWSRSVVEVDRLPGVEHQRSRARAVARLGALVAHQRAGQPVEPLGRVHEDHRGRGVGLAGCQPHLAGRERLATAEHRRVRAGPLGEPLDEVLVVAAPRDVRGPHLARPEAEARRAGHHEQRRVVPGAAAATGAQPGAVGERRGAAGSARGTSGR